MHELDYKEVQKHINILNVAYHLCLEIVDNNGYEYRAICPFCGYNKNSKIPTMGLNSQTNQYGCCRCKAQGFSTELYAKVRRIDTKKAYKELLQRECYSQNREHIEISPINILSDIECRDRVYRELLSMLKLEKQHKKYLVQLGFLESSIENNLYKTIPKNYIKRLLICNNLSKKYNLAGTPGFFQEENFKWCFSSMNGFFVPIFNEFGYIEGLSIHLDKPFNENQDLWFSSKDKINGTCAKNWVMRNNITKDSNSLIITDNFILGNYIRETLGFPTVAFQNISNSYSILKEIENTNIKNIMFILRNNSNKNLQYIINRVFRDLIPLGFNLDIKYINEFKDIIKYDIASSFYNSIETI